MTKKKNFTHTGRWLTEQELATRLGLSGSAISERRRTGGDLPRHITTGPRTHMYPEKDVQAWLDARTTDLHTAVVDKQVTASRTNRADVPEGTATVQLGGFTVTATTRTGLHDAVAACPARLTVLDLVTACVAADSLDHVTWDGDMTVEQLRSVIVAMGTHIRRTPVATAEVNRSLATSYVLTALMDGAARSITRKENPMFNKPSAAAVNRSGELSRVVISIVETEKSAVKLLATIPDIAGTSYVDWTVDPHSAGSISDAADRIVRAHRTIGRSYRKALRRTPANAWAMRNTVEERIHEALQAAGYETPEFVSWVDESGYTGMVNGQPQYAD